MALSTISGPPSARDPRREGLSQLPPRRRPYPHWDRMETAQRDLSKIEATTVDELLCQLRAWWSVEECIVDEDSSEGRMILRLLKDLERLAAPSPPAEVVQFPVRSRS